MSPRYAELFERILLSGFQKVYRLLVFFLTTNNHVFE